MAQAAFQPLGERSKWRQVYDHLATLDIDTVVTYETLDGIIEADFRTNRAPYYRAMVELERHNRRTLENVPRVGYRVVDAPEHERLARKHQKRGFRQVRKAIGKVKSADRKRLSADEARRLDEHEARLSQLESMMRRQRERVQNIENVTAKTAGRQEQTDAKLEHVLEVLRKHGMLKEAV